VFFVFLARAHRKLGRDVRGLEEGLFAIVANALEAPPNPQVALGNGQVEKRAPLHLQALERRLAPRHCGGSARTRRSGGPLLAHRFAENFFCRLNPESAEQPLQLAACMNAFVSLSDSFS
jgi:hypothetical protein